MHRMTTYKLMRDEQPPHPTSKEQSILPLAPDPGLEAPTVENLRASVMMQVGCWVVMLVGWEVTVMRKCFAMVMVAGMV